MNTLHSPRIEYSKTVCVPDVIGALAEWIQNKKK